MSLNNDQLKKVIKLFMKQDQGYCSFGRIYNPINKEFGISEYELTKALADLTKEGKIDADFFYTCKEE